MFQDKEQFRKAFEDKFVEIEGKSYKEGTRWEHYHVLVLMLRNHISQDIKRTNERYNREGLKQVYYFSMEFLIGRLLSYYLMNLGYSQVVYEGLKDLDLNLEDLIKQESDAGLGNGGLGRLAACYMDSMASLGLPGHGNGIRYKYGLFQQKIVDGAQAEVADQWLRKGYPWEIRQAEKAVVVHFGGRIRTEMVEDRLRFFMEDEESILAVPYDIPLVGDGRRDSINNLRLWSAEPVNEAFDLACFNRGEFCQALNSKASVEAISYILYPDDSNLAGQELRLKQEYFFVAAGLGAIIRRFKKKGGDLHRLADKISVHINDTHPALCIPELMRILMDQEDLGWEEAWNITVNVMSFTNHTILPEALEKWPVDLLRRLLPRVYMIIEEIDRRFRQEIKSRFPDEPGLIHETALLRNGQVYMANLAIIGSHSINGVAQLHSEILKKEVFPQFYRLYPYKFTNVTNGVSHRRFLLHANPRLSALISEKIGTDWIQKPEALKDLLDHRQDGSFLDELARVKGQNKRDLAEYIEKIQGIPVDPESIFDIQVKRIHAYKRQLLNALRIMYLYNCLKEGRCLVPQPVTFLFAGKAAPGYHYAKEVIKLIHAIADKVNQDPQVSQWMRVVFLENFNVSLAERIYPAADISEQISTASQEASGTGNMKFMMNGAVTLGTLDGANVEIHHEVGSENIRIFGLKAEQVLAYYRQDGYKSWDIYHQHTNLKNTMDQLINGFFPNGQGNFQTIFDSLLRDNDQYFVLKDFHPYVESFKELVEKYTDQKAWQEMALVNIAHSGFFSSDRSIMTYARDIWKMNL